MAILPADIPTGLVTGQFYFVNEDNIDADTDPDLTVVSGTVTFTCEAKDPLRMPTKKAVVIPMKFDAEFDSQGRLVPRGQTNVGIELPASNSALFNPTNFTWKVEFNLVDVATGYTVVIPAFSIIVPEGVTSDIVDLMPVSTSPGTIMVQGPAGPNTIPTDNAVATNVNTAGTATRTALDGRYAAKSVVDAATSAATPGTLVVRNSGGDAAFRRVTASDAPSAADQLTRKDYVDAADLLKADLTELNSPTLRFDQFPAQLTDAVQVNSTVHNMHSVVRVPGGIIYAVFWGADMNPYIAKMKEGEYPWQVFNLGTLPGNPLNAPAPLDEHNQIAMHVDGNGFIHVSGNHHRVPLNYIRSTVANEITDWETPGMVGTNELEVTYPAFVKLSDGSLLFFYRDGTSSDGDLMLNKYDLTTKTWARVGMILKGHDWLTTADDMSAYNARYVYDATTGRLHLWWVWRDTTSVDSNVDFCYMFSSDNGATWQNAASTTQTLPVKPDNTAVKVLTGGSGHVASGACYDASGNAYAALRMADGENRLYKRAGATVSYTVIGTGMGHVALVYNPDGNIYAVYNGSDGAYVKPVSPTVGTAVRIWNGALNNWTPGLTADGNTSTTIRMMIAPARKVAGATFGGILTMNISAANLAKIAAGTVALPKPTGSSAIPDPIRHTPGSYGMVPDMCYGPAGPRGSSSSSLANGTFQGQLITAARAGKIVEATINVTTAGGAGAKVRIVAFRPDGKLVAQSSDIDTSTTGQKTIAFVCNIGKNEQFVLGVLHHSSAGASAVLTATSGQHDSRIPFGSPTNYFSGVKSGWAITGVPVPATDRTSFLNPATGAALGSNDNIALVSIKCGARPADWLSGSE